MNQDKLQEALKELVTISIQEGLCIEFKAPEEDPQMDFGSFAAASRTIEIYKERTEPLTAFHIYAFAHELKHWYQWKSLDGYESWLFNIGAVRNDNQEQSARLEIEADEFAISFLRRHHIRVSKKLKEFIEDRKEHYEERQG